MLEPSRQVSSDREWDKLKASMYRELGGQPHRTPQGGKARRGEAARRGEEGREGARPAEARGGAEARGEVRVPIRRTV